MNTHYLLVQSIPPGLYTVLGVAGWFATALIAVMWWREMELRQRDVNSSKFWHNAKIIWESMCKEATDVASELATEAEHVRTHNRKLRANLRGLEKQRAVAVTTYHNMLSAAHDEIHSLTAELEKAQAIIHVINVHEAP